MRRVFCSILVLVSAAAAGAERLGVEGQVSYVHAEQIYTDLGTANGITPGMPLEIESGQGTIAHVKVLLCGAHTSVARIVDQTRQPRLGDRVIAPQAVRPVAAGQQPLRAAASTGSWEREEKSPFPMVAFTGDTSVPTAAKSFSVSTSLLAATWISLDGGKSETYQRDQLGVTLLGSPDRARHFLVDLDLLAIGQPLAPDTRRFSDNSKAWVEVYRALVAYHRDSGFGAALGRAPFEGLRYGLLDGATLSYAWDDGPCLDFSGGMRPQTVRLYPSLDRPAAALGLSGQARRRNGFLDYGAEAAWFGGSGGATEGSETSLHLGVSSGRLWLNGEAGLVTVVDSPGHPAKATLDRASLGGTCRIGELGSIGLALRRWQDVAFPSELGDLPGGYLVTPGTYDGSVNALIRFATWRRIMLDGDITGGATVSPNDTDRRYRVSPGLTITAPWWLRLRVHLGYEMALGWLGGQQGELSIGIEPIDRLRIDLAGQGGMLFLQESGSLMPLGSGWLRCSWTITDGWHIVARGRGLFGDAGNGVEGSVMVLADDLF